MGRKSKRGGGVKTGPPVKGEEKETDVPPTLSKSAKREVTELVTQLLESRWSSIYSNVRFCKEIYFAEIWNSDNTLIITMKDINKVTSFYR